MTSLGAQFIPGRWDSTDIPKVIWYVTVEVFKGTSRDWRGSPMSPHRFPVVASDSVTVEELIVAVETQMSDQRVTKVEFGSELRMPLLLKKGAF